MILRMKRDGSKSSPALICAQLCRSWMNDFKGFEKTGFLG